MADTIKRDKSGMWTEMPPSAKNRKPDIRQPIPAPVPENNNNTPQLPATAHCLCYPAS